MAEKFFSVKGVYTLIDQKIVTSALTDYDFAPTLDGNSDGAYRIEYRFVNDNASSSTYVVRINGASMTGRRQYMLVNGTSVSGGRDTTMNFAIAQGSASTNTTEGILQIPVSKTGDNRIIHTDATRYESTTFSIWNTYLQIGTPSNSTNITQLGFHANSSNGLGVGTVMRLYKLT